MESKWNIAEVGMSSWERTELKGPPCSAKGGRVLLCAGCRGGGDACPRGCASALQVNRAGQLWGMLNSA